jgi:hypothetical protein
MRQLLLTGAALAALTIGAGTAHAALVSLGPSAGTEGLTYTLESMATANPLVEEFALTITGENTAADLEGGVNAHRTGINAIAFNTVSKNNPASGTMLSTTINGVTKTSPNTGFTFVPGGLASSGCDGSGGFFCFDNTAIPPIPASPDITGKVTLVFSATLDAGSSWANYTTAFKIDWVGPGTNNFNLVSLDIPVNTDCPDCGPGTHSAPEPASLAILGVGLLGLGVVTRRSRRSAS